MMPTDQTYIAGDDRDPVLVKVREFLGGSTEDRATGRLAGAWELFFETYTPLIDVMVSRSGLSTHEAEDCAQEVWVEVVRCFPALDRSDSPAAFTAWLANVVRTQVARQIRLNKKHGALFGGDGNGFDRPVDFSDDVDRLADREMVTVALARLKRQTSELNYPYPNQHRHLQGLPDQATSFLRAIPTHPRIALTILHLLPRAKASLGRRGRRARLAVMRRTTRAHLLQRLTKARL